MRKMFSIDDVIMLSEGIHHSPVDTLRKKGQLDRESFDVSF